jgi:hypothetical protein
MYIFLDTNYFISFIFIDRNKAYEEHERMTLILEDAVKELW